MLCCMALLVDPVLNGLPSVLLCRLFEMVHMDCPLHHPWIRTIFLDYIATHPTLRTSCPMLIFQSMELRPKYYCMIKISLFIEVFFFLKIFVYLSNEFECITCEHDWKVPFRYRSVIEILTAVTTRFAITIKRYKMNSVTSIENFIFYESSKNCISMNFRLI